MARYLVAFANDYGSVGRVLVCAADAESAELFVRDRGYRAYNVAPYSPDDQDNAIDRVIDDRPITESIDDVTQSVIAAHGERGLALWEGLDWLRRAREGYRIVRRHVGNRPLVWLLDEPNVYGWSVQFNPDPLRSHCWLTYSSHDNLREAIDNARSAVRDDPTQVRVAGTDHDDESCRLPYPWPIMSAPLVCGPAR